MASAQVSTLFPTYALSARGSAGLQILNHAIFHIAGEYRNETELLARLDAGALMWEARERILRATGRAHFSPDQGMKWTRRVIL